MMKQISSFSLKMKMAFGKFPKTSVLEENINRLRSDFDRFNQILESDDYKRFQELTELINSEEFKNKRKEIQSLQFKGSEEYNKYKEHLKLEKDKKLKVYFSYINSENITRFENIRESEQLAEFNKLQEEIQSDEFKNIKKTYSFKNTDEFKREQEFKSLSKNSELKKYFKLLNSKEFKAYQNLVNNDKPEKFEELQKKTSSPEFKTQLKEYKKNNSEEYQLYLEFVQLSKDAELKLYQKFIKSSNFEIFKKWNDSEDLAHFENLKKEVLSENFKKFKKEYLYKNSEFFQKEEKFNSEKKSAELSFYFKHLNSKERKIYDQIHESDILRKSEELKEYVNSTEFIEFKEFRENKKRYETTEEYAKEQELAELSKLDDIIWVQKTQKKNEFASLENLDLVFEDDFEGNSLNQEKWMNKYYWGDALLNEAYALENDKHWFTEGKNIQISDSVLKINLRKEAAKGKVWNPAMGFYERNFDFTSGMINTAKSFRQKFGIVEAKIKLSSHASVLQALWMVAGRLVPHIDIVNTINPGKSVMMGNFWAKGELNGEEPGKNIAKIKGIDLSKDFHILRFEWTADRMVWKINGLEIASANSGIPEDEMYLNFSLGINESDVELNSEVAMEIDWVRCYKLPEQIETA